MPVLGILFAAHSALTVRRISVEGTAAVSNDRVLKRIGMGSYDGASVFLLPGAARRALLKDPWIKDVRVKRNLRGSAVIRIEEMEPFCLLATLDGTLRYVDSSGREMGLAPVVGHGMDYPVISAPEGFVREGMRVLNLSASSRYAPRWDDISEVVVLADGGFEVFTNRGLITELGADIEAQWKKFEKISRNLHEKSLKPKYINLRRAGVGIVRLTGR